MTPAARTPKNQDGGVGYTIRYTPRSSVTERFHILAAMGGGDPHTFEIDTGSVGILVPRSALGADYQNFDPTQDIEFSYVSSGEVYKGQWVPQVSVVLGVPQSWDGTGDYPTAVIDVFAADQAFDPQTQTWRAFDGGMFGIGFAIGGPADGGSVRNPLRHATYKGAPLAPGYILTLQGIELGPGTADPPAGFSLVPLTRPAPNKDWEQPIGRLDLQPPAGVDWAPFTIDLPVLIDTGILDMLLWLAPAKRPPSWPTATQLPNGATVSIALPAGAAQPALQYSFIIGAADQPPTAPASVNWDADTFDGINTGIHVMAGFDYLFDAAGGRIGFRARS